MKDKTYEPLPPRFGRYYDWTGYTRERILASPKLHALFNKEAQRKIDDAKEDEEWPIPDSVAGY